MALGYPHPDHMLAELNSAQLTEWMAYYQLEPFGYYSEWMRFAKLLSLTASINRKKGTSPMEPKDFMPQDPEIGPQPKQAVEEQKRVMMGFVRGWGKRHRKGQS